MVYNSFFVVLLVTSKRMKAFALEVVSNLKIPRIYVVLACLMLCFRGVGPPTSHPWEDGLCRAHLHRDGSYRRRDHARPMAHRGLRSGSDGAREKWNIYASMCFTFIRYAFGSRFEYI